MKPFNLEEARKGAQIVHVDGRKAKDWYYFGGARWPIHIQWEGGNVGSYTEADPRIGLFVKQVVEYVAFDEDGFYAGRDTLNLAVDNCPNAIAYFKLSADEGANGWSMEKVDWLELNERRNDER